MGLKSLSILGALLLLAGQDPPDVSRPRPPRSPATLPPVEEPFRTTVDRSDLIQQFEARHPLQGIYELREIVRPGRAQVPGTTGYLVIGRRHLSFNIRGPGSSPRVPAFQASFRRYTVLDDQLLMSTLVGHRNEPGGDILIEEQGLTEVRRFSLTGAVLRIMQGGESYMEFVRIE